jgi:penicillin-binding protein 2
MTDNSRVRVSIVGVIVVALFGALLARLWFLQVGSGETYEVRAEQRALRTVQTEMPRGRILDADGEEIVSNRVVWALSMDRDVDEKTRATVFGRLAELLGGRNTPGSLEKRFDDVRQSPLRPALIVVDTPPEARVTVSEHPDDFPGVTLQQLTVRSYPSGPIAAQVLGYVGEVNSDELKELEGYVNGDTIGRSGVEAAYEQELRGTPRRDTYEVDPTGRPVGEPVETRHGTVGQDVQLALDLDVQRVAEESLADAILKARERTFKTETGQYPFKAPGGAVVVLNAQTGGVVAMASFPTYNPSRFVGGITQEDWDALTHEGSGYPLSNRATQGLYAPGSTFKLVTGVAGTRYGVRGAYQWYEDNGYIVIGDDNRDFQNAGRKAHGGVDLRRALTVSSDVYFYDLGYQMWNRWAGGDTDSGYAIQHVSREFGFAEKTGIEVSEAQGRVPDADWKTEFAKVLYPDDEAAQEENSRWYPGDNVNLSVGQGDLVVTPLQLANAYAAFANNGTLYEPHLAAVVKNAKGKAVERVEPKPRRTLQLDPATYQQMQAGFTGAVQDAEEGTAAPAFAGFPFGYVPVAGKTGTAQVASTYEDGTPRGDTSWFAGYFSAHGTQYVAVTVIEEAGFGSEVAAPVTRRVIESVVGLPLTPLVIKQTDASD